jgi:hypothetical protein
MSSIRFNMATKEIEIDGPESFIKSNFSKIRDLLIESLGMRKPIAFRKTKKAEYPVLFIVSVETEIIEEIKISEESQAPEGLQANAPGIPDVPQETKRKRPPVRKYIRPKDRSSSNDQVVSLIQEIPEKISLASLKEKFGLTEQQIEVVIREAEKQGRIRKDMDGSYVWVRKGEA